MDDKAAAAIDGLGSDYVFKLFERAIGIIRALQSIAPDKSCVAFQRHQSFEMLLAEAKEFTEFYAVPLGLRKPAQTRLELAFEALCETVNSLPRKLSHFDFNAYNLFVDAAGALRVLDFQDACMAAPARDIVSLLNDRGMDEVLGPALHRRLLQAYTQILDAGSEFHVQYHCTLLHWDFRVCGRFKKLDRKQETARYEQWIPGTLRRLGRTLKAFHRELHGFDDVLQILHDFSPQAREGATSKWE